MKRSQKTRRSWLVVPSYPSVPVLEIQQYGADVVVLDLEYSVSPKNKEQARLGLSAQIAELSRTVSDIFVRVAVETRWADVRAAVSRGLRGIVLPSPDEPADIVELDGLLTELEKARGLEVGSIEIVLMFESAQSFWKAEALGRASSRITALGVGRIDLSMMLGRVANNEFRLFRFLMTRALLAARMLGKQPLGAFWRPGSRGGVGSVAQTLLAAKEARLLGFDGCVCALPEQVAPVHAGMTY